MKLFAKLRDRRAKGETGFTLIELLVVVVILGVLIAIAVPLYLNYRKGVNDSAAQSDVRNAISVLESCNAGAGAYPIQTTSFPVGSATDSLSIDACPGQPTSLSKGTFIKYLSNATGTCYVIVGTNASGTPKYFFFNSAVGGAIASVNAGVYNSPPGC